MEAQTCLQPVVANKQSEILVLPEVLISRAHPGKLYYVGEPKEDNLIVKDSKYNLCSPVFPQTRYDLNINFPELFSLDDDIKAQQVEPNTIIKTRDLNTLLINTSKASVRLIKFNR